MSTDIRGELERLSQTKNLAEIGRKLDLMELIIVHLSDYSGDHLHGFVFGVGSKHKNRR
jgi:hypothetical protein